MDPPDELNPELESFREQWRAEVRARKQNPSSQQRQRQPAGGRSQTSPKASRAVPRAAASARSAALPDNDDGFVPGLVFDDAVPAQPAAGEDSTEQSENEPVSALEYYEMAVEKEAQGSLGDSLRMYRKAFRMDNRVDLKFKNKHFPGPPPSRAAASATVSQAPSAAAPPAAAPLPAQPQSTKDLIAGFAGLSIEPAPPQVEGMDPPPCPIASLPEELLVHILEEVAALDVADFVRLAQVCRRLAWLVATEDRIWRRVCLGRRFGFAGMHRRWQRDVAWGPLPDARLLLGGGAEAEAEALAAAATTHALLRSGAYSSSWLRMFRLRPRVRFNGCYISTVNYIRSGQASANQITWNSPVHIVTYYRYLRLFRDGTALSLLTTEEPAAVVHHLTRDALALHRGPGGGPQGLPSAVMRDALKGRWRLALASASASASASAPDPDAAAAPEEEGEGGAGGTAGTAAAAALVSADAEGDLFVETEGVGPKDKYMYSMELALASAGRGAKNNKLTWKAFYSYNKLTDDWSEFGLKHYKPFFFSRVKSYGLGE